MKKTRQFVICIIVITLITLSTITAYAAMCSHEWKYWEVLDVVSEYEYIDSGICYETTTMYVECKICGTNDGLMSYSILSHDWIRENLGHISGTNTHRFSNTCSQCGYSFNTDEFCSTQH
jgi:hypothetical protein